MSGNLEICENSLEDISNTTFLPFDKELLEKAIEEISEIIVSEYYLERKEENMKTEIIKIYDNRDDVTLTTYILQDSPEMLAGKTRPAILICPGGAYLNCSDREAEPIAMKFASMGYHTFVLRYSVYCEGGKEFADISKPITVKAHCKYPIPMREIGKSMLIIREHANEWFVDTERIALCGFSAGAHNVAMYATNWHKNIISEYFNKDKENFRPAAIILGYTLSDYIFMRDNFTKAAPTDIMLFKASITALLGTDTPSEELLDEVSPAKQVTENMPPTYLWATANDELVPVQHSLLLAYALAEHNIPFELHIFEEGMHGLALATQATAASKKQIQSDAAKWADLAGCWLEKRFAFTLPDKTHFEEMIEKEIKENEA